MNLFGPFAVRNLGAQPVISADPDTGGAELLTYPLASGEHYTATPEALAAFGGLLTPYRVYPQSQLQAVMAGDEPDAAPWVADDPPPVWNTIPLKFPGAETAAAVIAEMEAGG